MQRSEMSRAQEKHIVDLGNFASDRVQRNNGRFGVNFVDN